MNKRQAKKVWWSGRAEKEWRLLRREVIALNIHGHTRRGRQTRKWWKAYERTIKAKLEKEWEDE